MLYPLLRGLLSGYGRLYLPAHNKGVTTLTTKVHVTTLTLRRLSDTPKRKMGEIKEDGLFFMNIHKCWLRRAAHIQNVNAAYPTCDLGGCDHLHIITCSQDHVPHNAGSVVEDSE